MRRGRVIVIVLIFLIVIGGGVYLYVNQNKGGMAEPTQSPDQQAAASQGLANFQQLITKDNYKGMGLDSFEDASLTALGDPLPVYRVQLDEIKAFKSGDDAQKILIDDKRILYPITVRGQVVSSLYVGGTSNGWRTTDYGSANVMKAIAKFRQAKDDFVVQIPALQLYFIGRRVESGLTLTPIIDDPRFRLSVGKTLTANDVLLAIQPTAQNYNGLPQ